LAQLGLGLGLGSDVRASVYSATSVNNAFDRYNDRLIAASERTAVIPQGAFITERPQHKRQEFPAWSDRGPANIFLVNYCSVGMSTVHC